MDLCTPRRWQVVFFNHLTLYFIMELSIGFIVVIAIASFVALSVFFHFVPFFLWMSARVSGVRISLLQLALMRLRNVPPNIIVPSLIEAHKAGLNNITRDNLEAHYMTGGHVQRVVHALVSASKANIDLSFEKATAIDLAGVKNAVGAFSRFSTAASSASSTAVCGVGNTFSSGMVTPHRSRPCRKPCSLC